MKDVDIRKALGAGWKNFTRRGWYLIGITVSYFILFVLAQGDMVIAAFAYILLAGYTAAMIAHFRGATITFDDLVTVSDWRWVSFGFVSLIKTLLIMLGLLVFIVPGIYLAIKWMFAELLVIDKGMKPMEALAASSQMTEGHRWKLFWYTIVVLLVMLVGLALLVVGIIPAIIIAFFATIALYENLKHTLDASAGSPEEHHHEG